MSETSRCNASEIRSPVAANRLISAAYVFGRNEPEFSWEITDKAVDLAADAATKILADA